MADQSLIAPSFRPRTSSGASAGNAPSETQLRQFSRFLGRVLVALSILCFALSGYLGFADYWFLTHWTRAEATALGGEIRQGSSASGGASRGQGGSSSNSYYFHCTVSYMAAGTTLQSQLDSPASAYRVDAQVWGASLAPGQKVDILYQSANPSRIRLANNPAEITLTGSIEAAFLFLVPGLLLVFASRPE